MSEFKKGDRVILDNLYMHHTLTGHMYSAGENNPFDTKGTVTSFSTYGTLNVRWDNGKVNSYNAHNLRLLKEFKDE